MKTYTNKISGEVLERRKRTQSNNAYTFELRSSTGSQTVGSIYFRVNRAASELEVFTLNVSGHNNAATATGNPHPGVGRLLMCLACKFAAKQGARRVRLSSGASAVGFYLRMGFHRPIASNPVSLSGPFVDGELNAQWMIAFRRNFASTRRDGFLQAELATVLLNITTQTNGEWEERRDGLCTMM